jgi:hypothetical protein
MVNIKKTMVALALSNTLLVASSAATALEDNLTLNLSTTIPKAIKVNYISGSASNPIVKLTAIDATASSDWVGQQQLCIHSTDTINGLYKVSVVGGSQNAFNLKAQTYTLPYQVFWKTKTDAGSYNTAQELKPGIELTNQQAGAPTLTKSSCSSSGVNTLIEFKIAGNDYRAAAGGSYIDNLTILVSNI